MKIDDFEDLEGFPAEARMSRRELLGAAAVTGLVFSFGGNAWAAGVGKPTITFDTWETYDELPWVNEYAKKHGVNIKRVVIGSVDEAFTKIKSGAVPFDMVIPDSGSILRYKSANLLDPLNLARVPDIKNITRGLNWKTFGVIGGKAWAIPYNWGTQPLMYNADEIKKPPMSWKALWDPKYKGRVAIPDDAYITIPMVSLAIGQKNIFNLTNHGFDQLRTALRTLRKQLTTLSTGFNDQLNQFANGSAVIGYNQNISEVFQLQAKGHNIRYTFPVEGVPQWADCWSIAPRAKQSAIVYAFMNEHWTVPWQAKFIEFSFNNGILTSQQGRKSVKGSVVRKTNLVDQDTAGFWKKMVTFKQPENFDKRIQLWNQFKTGF